jgi:hypothetical protein
MPIKKMPSRFPSYVNYKVFFSDEYLKFYLKLKVLSFISNNIISCYYLIFFKDSFKCGGVKAKKAFFKKVLRKFIDMEDSIKYNQGDYFYFKVDKTIFKLAKTETEELINGDPELFNIINPLFLGSSKGKKKGLHNLVSYKFKNAGFIRFVILSLCERFFPEPEKEEEKD